MRILALAGALLLFATGAAQAQTSADLLRAQAAQAGGAGAASRAAPRTPATAPATTPSTSPFMADPLAGATSASATVSQPGVSAGTPPAEAAGFITTSNGLILPVFGTQLFTGTYAGSRPSDRPDYVIQPGDQVVVNLFGAVNTGSSQTVDASGTVFITGVGPVNVGGIPLSQLQTVVSGRVREVFTGAVGVYAQVGAAGSIGVFISGDIRRPGRYLGAAADSVLYYLSQGGGIDPSRGSFRNITVQRNGQTVAQYDLYDFLLNGRLDPIRFQDGDVVFVAPRGPMVGVAGPVRNAFAFEMPAGQTRMTGADLIPMARPEPTVNGASVQGFRNNAHRSAFFPLADLARVVLGDGDFVNFRSDSYLDLVTVTVQGEVRGPRVHVLPRGSTLSQLLARIPLEGTDVEPRFVHIKRLEVAMEQKRALDEALFNLQKQVLTTAPSTPEAGALATAQATLINQFVERASMVVPDGNIAVYTDGQFNDIRLQNNDLVILPNRTDVVIVAGEILNPGALAHADNVSLARYVGRAGGFAPNANKKRFVIRHRDGSAEVAGPNVRPGPGDEIVVLPKVSSRFMQSVRDISQLLFQMAITAGTVINLADSNTN